MKKFKFRIKRLITVLLSFSVFSSSLIINPITVKAADPVEVFVYDNEVPYQIFSLNTGYSSSYSAGGVSNSATSGRYDLSRVQKMKTTIVGACKGWTSGGGGSFTWYDKDNQPITELNQNGVEVNVATIARNRDLTDCYCRGVVSGTGYYPHGSGGEGSWPDYWGVAISSFTAVVTEGTPRGPSFNSNLPPVIPFILLLSVSFTIFCCYLPCFLCSYLGIIPVI